MPTELPTGTTPALTGSCSCGANTFEITASPTERFICHCLYCQNFVGQSYTDVVMLVGKDVTLHQDNATYNNPHVLPTGFAKSHGLEPRFGNPDKGRFARCANLDRATCDICGDPFAETVANMVFIPAKNFRTGQLPPVRHHVYGRFHTDAPTDTAPRHARFLGSQAAIMRMLVGALRSSRQAARA